MLPTHQLNRTRHRAGAVFMISMPSFNPGDDCHKYAEQTGPV